MKKILIIDNDPIHGYITERFLKYSSLNCESELILGAEKALNYLQSDSLPDVILLDLLMPDMDGIQFLIAFNKLKVPGKKKIKIVVLTISDSVTLQTEALQLGAIGILSKPLKAEELIELIGNE